MVGAQKMANDLVFLKKKLLMNACFFLPRFAVVLCVLSILVSSFGLLRLGQNYLVPWVKAVKYL